jgi:hypothetical protein
MKINGINLHSTFPGEIQLLTTCDTVGAMTCQLHGWTGTEARERGFRIQVQGFRRHGRSGHRGRKLEPTHIDCYESRGAGAFAKRSAQTRVLAFTDIHPYSPKFTGVHRYSPISEKKIKKCPCRTGHHGDGATGHRRTDFNLLFKKIMKTDTCVRLPVCAELRRDRATAQADAPMAWPGKTKPKRSQIGAESGWLPGSFVSQTACFYRGLWSLAGLEALDGGTGIITERSHPPSPRLRRDRPCESDGWQAVVKVAEEHSKGLVRAMFLRVTDPRSGDERAGYLRTATAARASAFAGGFGATGQSD